MRSHPQVIVRYEALHEAVYSNDGSLHEAVDSAAQGLGANDMEKARYIAAFNNGMGELQLVDTGSTIMASAQNGVASRIQAAVAAYASERGQLKQVRPAQTLVRDGVRIDQPELLEVKFDSADVIQWAKMWAEYMLFRPKRAAWIDPPKNLTRIPNDAVIAVFGDWGSGLYGSTSIRDQINTMDVCHAVVHLGDTYYAGADDEVAKRLVGNWPTRAGMGKCLHRTLNGNHEMYSGAHAYFAALKNEPFSDQKSSCFAMHNDDWLLLGLDTSYTWGDKHGDIDDSQVKWIDSMIAAAGDKKVLIFSHHQIYSQFDDVGVNLQASLGHLLDTQRIYGWYFGHEHRLVVFDDHPQWKLKARCMGHGGFPEFRNTKLSGFATNKSQWISLAASTNVPAAQIWDGPNIYINDDTGDPQKYVPHGYLVLEFDGKTVSETFKDPAGQLVRPKVLL